ncbi:phage portal protein [Paenibacillus sp. JX-17]|uniref:Phage portal protein n=1 Tax=Paenibacillus lacisoli TaxID=3064525 RepID=A0ABT9CIK7_9BACL|nr:phage portal protein [Paenibacillus sp. JX-17]MDO7908439.1 phage portal protein [Paenibacillus sp. JX-17]
MSEGNAAWIPIVKSEEERHIPSSAQLPDAFDDLYDVHGLLSFPAGNDPASCRLLVKNSNILPQCIEAYKRNIAGYGIALEYLPGESDKTAKEEWDRAEKFLETCNLEDTPDEIISHLIEDLESTGMSNVEVAWPAGSEFPTIFRMDPKFVRSTKESERATIKRKRRISSTKKVEEFSQEIYTRKYAMKRGSSVTWFRLFGTEGNENQIIPLRINNDGPYGEPRWFGNAPGVVGSREAEELNVSYFSNGRMLSMILTVTNGRLTKQSMELLRNVKGTQSQGGILYLEAKGEETGGPMDEKVEKVAIKLDKLNDLLQQDALFLEYGKEKKADILSAFRLPPILVGQSSDYNRATADAALRFAEEQVFEPYRKWIMNEIFNKRLFPALGIFRVRAVLRGPQIIDPEDRKAMLEFIADRGIMLVRDLIPIAEDVLGTTVDETKFSPEYLDTPITQLASSQPALLDPEGGSDAENLQGRMVSIAKRLLRHSSQEASVHV